MIEFGFFTLGFISGIAFTALLLTFYVRRLFSKDRARTEEKVKEFYGGKIPDMATMKSVEERLAKVKAIVQQQLDLQSAADGPQRNAMDGRYKNGIISEVKRLEEEKAVVLQSIIDDGFNPTITIMNDEGAVEQMTLSDFMGLQQERFDTKKPSDKSAPKKVGKFTVIQGGKGGTGDGGGETTH